MATDYATVTQRAQHLKNPVERAERCAADQRRLKQEAADRRAAASLLPAKTVASRRHAAR